MFLFILVCILIQQTISQCSCGNFTAPTPCNNYYTCNWYGNSCYEQNCTTINNQTKCLEPQCTWMTGSCHVHTGCNYIQSHLECNKVFGCIYNDGFCLDYETCSYTTKATCKGTTPAGISCYWNDNSNQCVVFQTCNRLHLDDCEIVPYCIQVKKECKNKSELDCSKIKDESECSNMINYQCIWQEDSCIYQGCDSYSNSQLNCQTHGCTWTGAQCVYCNLNWNYSEQMIAIGLFLSIIIF